MKVIESSKDESIDLLVFDVDQKDPSLPLRCPPQSFVEEKTLNHAKRIISKHGIVGKCLMQIPEILMRNKFQL